MELQENSRSPLQFPLPHPDQSNERVAPNQEKRRMRKALLSLESRNVDVLLPSSQCTNLKCTVRLIDTSCLPLHRRRKYIDLAVHQRRYTHNPRGSFRRCNQVDSWLVQDTHSQCRVRLHILNLHLQCIQNNELHQNHPHTQLQLHLLRNTGFHRNPANPHICLMRSRHLRYKTHLPVRLTL